MRAAAVIVAAGSGRRFGGRTRKQFLDLGGQPVLAWSARAFASHRAVDEVVAVLPADIADAPPGWLASLGVRAVGGGATRLESVARGLEALESGAPHVLVHDGVRPFVSGALIERVAEGVRRGPVVPVVPVVETVKEVDETGRVVRTLERSRLARAQTPQGFPAEALGELYAALSGSELAATDDAQLCEERGLEVRTVPGDVENLKITEPADYEFARWLVSQGRKRPR